jgi:hypothetical protein
MSLADFTGLHQQCIDNALTYLLWHEDIRQKVGLEGISQLWTEPPSWYLWPRTHDVTFYLRLMEVEGWNDMGLGSYLVHAFPAQRNRKSIPALSQEEEQLLSAEFFDIDTATPHFEKIAYFDQAFIVGELSLILDEHGTIHLLCSTPVNQRYGQLLDRLAEMLGAMITFQQKRPATLAYRLNDPVAKSRIVVYDLNTLNAFADEFNFPAEALVGEPPGELSSLLTTLANVEARSHLAGTCGCSIDKPFPASEIKTMRKTT